MLRHTARFLNALLAAASTNAAACVRKQGVKVVFALFLDIHKADTKLRHMDLRAQLLLATRAQVRIQSLLKAFVPAARKPTTPFQVATESGREAFLTGNWLAALLQCVTELPDCATEKI